MKLILKSFQEDAVRKLVRYLRAAAKESKRDRQSVCLSSPTGSGKTVMLTRAIEVILDGDEDGAAISDAVFLWITDQPELNEQTRRKMRDTSSVLTNETLVVIDNLFKDDSLRSGCVHFLNVQKLGKDKGLLTKSDERDYTIWEIINNTVELKSGKFFLIIDEAHRGMMEQKGIEEANSIIQKFIKGSSGEIQPVPLVVGISATPERFHRLIAGTGRHTRPVDVDVQEVRVSGLIKDAIVLHHPTTEHPTDMTLLREAARSLKTFTSHWAKHCAAHEDVEVIPLLVVQVEDARNKGEHSATDIAEAVTMIRDVIGEMPSDAFAHAFQEGTSFKIAGTDLRYIAPSDIQNDQDVRVVFFKTSLNTGWDCPRAEVMMSFRTAADSTFIAQLVGRMVRTPLARKIIDNETLNTVALYLPKYDSKGLEKVIAKLSKPDDESSLVEVQMADEALELRKVAGSDAWFEALSAVPTYTIPRQRKSSQIRRLMKFARLLMNDDIDEDAPEKAKKELLAVLLEEFKTANKTKRFKEIVEDRAQVQIEAVNWDVGADEADEGEIITVDISSQNVEDLFEGTGRRLNSELHKEWLKKRVNADKATSQTAKLELFALCLSPHVIANVEKKAQELVAKWLKLHKKARSKKGEASQAGYDEIENLADKPEEKTLEFPGTILGKKADQTWKKHVYVMEKKLFSDKLNDDETAIIQEEIAKKEVVAWLRNTPRKKWALCVPYLVDGENRSMYPDFLIVRDDDGDLVVDVIDPHSIGISDAPAKAAGLANFAALHANRFGRIELILLDGKSAKRLDLTNETVRNKVRGITLPAELKRLFDE